MGVIQGTTDMNWSGLVILFIILFVIISVLAMTFTKIINSLVYGAIFSFAVCLASGLNVYLLVEETLYVEGLPVQTLEVEEYSLTNQTTKDRSYFKEDDEIFKDKYFKKHQIELYLIEGSQRDNKFHYIIEAKTIYKDNLDKPYLEYRKIERNKKTKNLSQFEIGFYEPKLYIPSRLKGN